MPQTITNLPKPQTITILLLVLLLPGQACAITEITVHHADYDGCVLLVIDGLGGAYCYPELTPRALDNSTLRKADCANVLAIAESGMCVIDVRAPVTSTLPGHSVIVTGRSDATPNTVSGETTIFDIAHDNGYFCAGVMENGDFKEMCDELDIILHIRKNSIKNPGISINESPYGHEDLSRNVGVLMDEWSNITEYLGDKEGAPRYVAYNRWAVDAADAVIKNLCESNVPFLLIINLAAVDSAGHHLGTSGYLEVVNGTDDTIPKLYRRCADHNLLFVLTADHGMGFATPGAAHGGHVSDKYSERPESQQIPLVFSGSGVGHGVIASAGQEDIAPTVLCQMGLPAISYDSSYDGRPLPVGRYADLCVTTVSDADVEVRGCDEVVRGTSDSKFIFKGLGVGCNYTIRVTRDGKVDEHEMFFDSASVVDYSAMEEFSVTADMPEAGEDEEEEYQADSADGTGGGSGTGTYTKILRIAIPIIIINFIGIFLIIKIMKE
ncbi:MAG: alkaline phosphatase family protein [Euryarchaeota archaeon]|nr:alkaline phosphatase family protein [Euryarchaeota archaeon]